MQQIILKPSTPLLLRFSEKERIYTQRLNNRDEITVTSICVKNRLLLVASAALNSCDCINEFHGVDSYFRS
jgi:hypothetical protein